MPQSETIGEFKKLLDSAKEELLLFQIKFIRKINEDAPFEIILETPNLTESLVLLLQKEISDLVKVLSKPLLPQNLMSELQQDDQLIIFLLYAYTSDDDIKLSYKLLQLDNLKANSSDSKEFLTLIKKDIDNIAGRLNELYCDYLKLEDSGKLFSPKEFQFIYSRSETSRVWEYESFVRQTDRPIPQQKVEVQSLIQQEVDKKVCNTVNLSSNSYKEANKLAIKFKSDGFHFTSVQLGIYQR